MQAVILKVKPGTRFHLGEYSERAGLTDTAEYIHSDVLFGAFINTLSLSYPEKVDVYRQYFETGQLKFSSGFYCIGNKQKEYNIIYLLPKPVSLNLEQTRETKKHKKIKFISKGIWENGLRPDEWFKENSLCHLPESNFVVLKNELEEGLPIFKLSEKKDASKVRVRTDKEEGNLYFQTDLVLLGTEDYPVHWYFLMDTSLKGSEITFIKEIIALMVAAGIGGERSSGCGSIDRVVYQDFRLQPKNPGKQFASVSLTIPTDDEIKAFLLYQTKIRGGMFCGSSNEEDKSNRLRAITAFTEGAIQAQPVTGSLMDLSQKGRLSWRYGGNFTLPLPDTYLFNKNLE
jgi:CRISPR-associated protein Csm4